MYTCTAFSGHSSILVNIFLHCFYFTKHFTFTIIWKQLNRQVFILNHNKSMMHSMPSISSFQIMTLNYDQEKVFAVHILEHSQIIL